MCNSGVLYTIPQQSWMLIKNGVLTLVPMRKQNGVMPEKTNCERDVKRAEVLKGEDTDKDTGVV